MLRYRAKRQGRNKCQRADQQYRADEQSNK